MNKITTLLFIALATTSLIACSTDSATATSSSTTEDTSTSTSTEDEDVTFEPAEVLVELDEIISTEDSVDMIALDDTMIELLYGIDPTILETYSARIPMDNENCEEYFIAKVTDGNMETVIEQLEARQATLEMQWSTLSDEQLELVQNYELVEIDNYIIFAVGYNAETVVQLFEAEFES